MAASVAVPDGRRGFERHSAGRLGFALSECSAFLEVVGRRCCCVAGSDGHPGPHKPPGPPPVAASSGHAFVVLQHGSHGNAADFDNIRSWLERRWSEPGSRLEDVPLEIWSTPVNEGLGTDSGLAVCGSRLTEELGSALKAVRAARPTEPLLLVTVAHSFGGPIMRYALAELETNGALNGVDLTSFIAIASPHAGARQLNPLFRLGARMLGKLFSTAYWDLLLDSEAMDKLCEPPALAVLARFRRRCMYTCASGDHLIGFETGSLMVPLEGQLADEPDDATYPSVMRTLVLQPFGKPSEGEGESRQVLFEGSDGSRGLSGIWESARSEAAEKVFLGFDDYVGRARRAATMVHALRSVGEWSLNVVRFRARLVLQHSAILHHPSRMKNPGAHGGDVAQHLASRICADVRQALGRGPAAQ